VIGEGCYGAFRTLDLIVVGIIVCDACLQRYGLECNPRPIRDKDLDLRDEDVDLIGEVYEKFRRIEGQTIRCIECIATAQVAQARRDGQPDPFPVYERTLTSHQKQLIQQLRDLPAREIEFKRSVVHPERSEGALFLTAGTYTRPLTVTTYCLVDPARQDHVVALA
jgi:hypothetical protein